MESNSQEHLHSNCGRMMDHRWGMNGWVFGFPWFWVWMGLVWLILLAVGYLVYNDAEQKGMNGLLWLILIILPPIGFLFLILYFIIREGHSRSRLGKSARKILDERYAKSELTSEEYQKMKRTLSNKENEKGV